MSTSATGPDSGNDDEQGVGDKPVGGDTRPPASATEAASPEESGAAPGHPSMPPYSAAPHPSPKYPGDRSTPGSGGPYQPTGYPPSPSHQEPFAQGPYPQGQYPQGQYQQAPYAQAPYGQGGYNQGPFGQPYAPQKSRVVAGLLGILLGSLGIHRFYLGFTTIGIIQILMSTVGAVFTFGLSAIAAGIWGLIEGIMILVGTEQFRRDAQGIPLKD